MQPQLNPLSDRIKLVAAEGLIKGYEFAINDAQKYVLTVRNKDCKRAVEGLIKIFEEGAEEIRQMLVRPELWEMAGGENNRQG